MSRHLAAVVPLVNWTPVTDSEWRMKGDHTLDELFAFVLRDWYSRPEKSPKVRWTVQHVRKLCKLGRLPAQPEVGHIIGWVEWLKHHYADGTVNLYWRTLRTVFELGAKAGFSRGNPAFPMALTKPKGKPHHIQDMVTRWPLLLGACETARERGFLAVQARAGLRRGEALALQAGDVRSGPEGWELLIRRQRTNPNTWATKATKGKRARNVPCTPELAELLLAVLAEGVARVKVGRGGQRVVESPFLFPFREHDLTALGERLRAAAPGALPATGKMWHAFRDTFAVQLYENGADIGQVRDWLGHSTETVTTEAYIGDVAQRVSRATLKFVGEATPPLGGRAPPGRTVALKSEPPTLAGVSGSRRSKAVGPDVQRQTTQQEGAPCSAKPRSQRSLPGLSVGPVVSKPPRGRP